MRPPKIVVECERDAGMRVDDWVLTFDFGEVQFFAVASLGASDTHSTPEALASKVLREWSHSLSIIKAGKRPERVGVSGG